MNSLLYVTTHNFINGDGITKKIFAQAKGFSLNNMDIILLGLEGNCIVSYTFQKGDEIDRALLCEDVRGNIYVKTKKILFYATRYLEISTYCYIRWILPSFTFIKYLIKVKNKNIKIGLEIPTYPFYAEQWNISNNKLRAGLKIFLDIFFKRIVYSIVDKVFVIRCRSKIKMYKNMIDISNGISDEVDIYEKNKISSDIINFIGVGTIYPYHGYDVFIRSIKKYYDCNGMVKIRFYIVGDSLEIENLKKLVNKLKLQENVIFCGRQFGASLGKLYTKCDIGVGTLNLKIRNADIDTAIKNIEYISKGLYVITSGDILNVPDSLYLKIETNTFNLTTIIDKYLKYSSLNTDYDSTLVCDNFKWSQITKNILRELL